MSQIGATPITAPGWTGKPKNGVAIVDCDVHHNFRNPEQLLPYLSTFNQEHLLDQGLHLGGYPNIPIRDQPHGSERAHEVQRCPGKEKYRRRSARFQFHAGIFARDTPRSLEYRLRAADRPPRFFTDIRDCPIQIGLLHCARRSTIGPSNIGLTATSVSSTPSSFRLQTRPKQSQKSIGWRIARTPLPSWCLWGQVCPSAIASTIPSGRRANSTDCRWLPTSVEAVVQPEPPQPQWAIPPTIWNRG